MDRNLSLVNLKAGSPSSVFKPLKSLFPVWFFLNINWRHYHTLCSSNQISNLKLPLYFPALNIAKVPVLRFPRLFRSENLSGLCNVIGMRRRGELRRPRRSTPPRAAERKQESLTPARNKSPWAEVVLPNLTKAVSKVRMIPRSMDIIVESWNRSLCLMSSPLLRPFITSDNGFNSGRWCWPRLRS